MKNTDMLRELDARVYGHEKAKKTLILSIKRSKQRYYDIQALLKEPEMSKLNVVLSGESGTGKTHLIESLAEIVFFPLIKLDATRICPSGNGKELGAKQIEEMIRDKAKKLVEEKKAFSLQGAIDQTVVFIDEVDKLGMAFESSGNWNNQIQASLLTLIDHKGEFKNVTWIMAGAFKRESREVNKSIGFTNINQEKQRDRYIDLTKQGIIPELAGRMGVVCELDRLEAADYIRILDNKHVYLTTEEKEKIAEETDRSGQGVRYLMTELDKRALESEWEEDNENFVSCY